jgi:hypothetical protein
MRGAVDWIGAQTDESKGTAGSNPPDEGQCADKTDSKRVSWQEFATHNFPARASVEKTRPVDDALDGNPDLWLYRSRTVSLLRRYWRFSLETGRLPSVVGREFFRAKVTSYKATTFEDRVIFIRDMEMCLNRLERGAQQLIARVIWQEYDQWDAARILNCGRATLQRRLYTALDLLSEDLLRVGMLIAVPSSDGKSR